MDGYGWIWIWMDERGWNIGPLGKEMLENGWSLGDLGSGMIYHRAERCKKCIKASEAHVMGNAPGGKGQSLNFNC